MSLRRSPAARRRALSVRRRPALEAMEQRSMVSDLFHSAMTAVSVPTVLPVVSGTTTDEGITAPRRRDDRSEAADSSTRSTGADLPIESRSRLVPHVTPPPPTRPQTNAAGDWLNLEYGGKEDTTATLTRGHVAPTPVVRHPRAGGIDIGSVAGHQPTTYGAITPFRVSSSDTTPQAYDVGAGSISGNVDSFGVLSYSGGSGGGGSGGSGGLPIVYISASDSSAAETKPGETPNPGEFTVSRTGGATGSLTVSFEVASPQNACDPVATPGSDHDLPASGTVTIPAGYSGVKFKVNPTDDNRGPEGPEAVIVSLKSGTGYTPSGGSATVWIEDNDPADLDGADAGSGTYLSEQEEGNPGVLIRDGSAATKAKLKAFKTNIPGYTRKLTWDNTKVIVKNGSTQVSSGLQLTEGDGDKVFTVEARSGLSSAETVVVLMETYNPCGTMMGGDTVSLRRLGIQILSPVDSNNDGLINDPGGNEFTFNSASPGVLTLPVRVRITPDEPAFRSRFQGKITATLGAIGSSTLTWTKLTGAPGTNVAEYDSGTGEWVTTAKFTGLPANNSDFGRKTATITMGSYSTKSVDYEVFFPRDAINNPGGVAENWFYYWNQTGAGKPNVIWSNDAITRNAIAQVPAMREWSTFVGPRDEIRISDSFRSELGFVARNNKTGIDGFANIVAHESRHVQQITDNNTLPFYTGVSGPLRQAAASGWSFNVGRGDPLYNHFNPGADGKPGIAGVDDDGDGTIDEQDEWAHGIGGDVDLDPDSDGLGTDPNGADFDGGSTVEGQAQTAETIAQDTFRTVDWASPGKQHGPDGGSTRGEINRFDN